MAFATKVYEEAAKKREAENKEENKEDKSSDKKEDDVVDAEFVEKE